MSIGFPHSVQTQSTIALRIYRFKTNIIYLILMNNQENSLLGFLKKKSLFKPSPVRNGVHKRSRSKSRDGKDSIIRKINTRDFEEEEFITLYNPNDTQRVDRYENQYQPAVYSKPEITRTVSQTIIQPKNEEKFDFTMQTQNNPLLTGLVAYGSFQSARLESVQCLDSLSIKLKSEVQNINDRIDQFRNSIAKILKHELKALRDEILRLVDEAFKESERSIQEYIQFQEQKLAGQTIKFREVLEKEYKRIETMKVEITRPQWRKVAGEIISTELEKTLEELIKKSNSAPIGKWEMKNLSGQRLKILQVQLRNLVRLKS